MNIKQQDLIKSASVGYHDMGKGTPWYCYADLFVKDYTVNLDRIYYKTIDDVVKGLKDRIQQALVDFEIPKP